MIQLIFALFTIPILCSSGKEHYYENFQFNLGIFNISCQPGVSLLDRQLYVDNVIPKPNGSNDYFLSANRTSCSQTELYETTREIEIQVDSFRFRETTATFYVLILDENDTMVENMTLNFDRLYNWRYDNFTFWHPYPFRVSDDDDGI